MVVVTVIVAVFVAGGLRRLQRQDVDVCVRVAANWLTHARKTSKTGIDDGWVNLGGRSLSMDNGNCNHAAWLHAICPYVRQNEERALSMLFMCLCRYVGEHDKLGEAFFSIGTLFVYSRSTADGRASENIGFRKRSRRCHGLSLHVTVCHCRRAALFWRQPWNGSSIFARLRRSRAGRRRETANKRRLTWEGHMTKIINFSPAILLKNPSETRHDLNQLIALTVKTSLLFTLQCHFDVAKLCISGRVNDRKRIKRNWTTSSAGIHPNAQTNCKCARKRRHLADSVPTRIETTDQGQTCTDWHTWSGLLRSIRNGWLRGPETWPNCQGRR